MVNVLNVWTAVKPFKLVANQFWSGKCVRPWEERMKWELLRSALGSQGGPGAGTGAAVGPQPGTDPRGERPSWLWRVSGTGEDAGHSICEAGQCTPAPIRAHLCGKAAPFLCCSTCEWHRWQSWPTYPIAFSHHWGLGSGTLPCSVLI